MIYNLMKRKKRYHKKYKFTYIKITVSTLFLCMLAVKGYSPFRQEGDNLFRLWVNGREVGTLGDADRAEELLVQARRNVAVMSDELVFLEAELSVEGEEVLWGAPDREEEVLRNMQSVLENAVRDNGSRSYSLKINENVVNLSSLEEVKRLLQTAIDKYDSEGKFVVELVRDMGRDVPVMTARVADGSRQEAEQASLGAGIQAFFSGDMGRQDVEGRITFEDYGLGIREMGFSEEIEIAESYLPEGRLTPFGEAVDMVLKEQDTPVVYEVVAGDVLSEIAIKVDVPMDKIVEMNDILEDENSILHIGDELVITVPRPQLSVTRVEEKYYEEIYEADIVYIDNDSWYTTKTEVLRQPSAGFRKIIADVYYENDKEVDRQILKEEIVMEAVAKVVERGTKVPPTYIKPVSGGRLTSGFGGRTAPVAGASTNHKGVDWAVPTGTAVYASCGGTVSKAGWGSGYGYVVYIEHEDGRQTRYGHLSKVQVKVGQKVRQGEKIALSGSTGNVSGPHLHFEILINGSQVNPLNHLN